jgi:hypothetical protein
MKNKIILTAFALALSGSAWAKLPAPPPADPVKAAEAKAKQDEAAAKDKALLAAAEDRVAARYIKEQKAKGKDVKPQMAAAAPAVAAKPAAAAKPAQPAKK